MAANGGGGNHVRLLLVADCQAFAATIQQQLSTFETVSQQAVVPDDLVITKYLSAEVVFEYDNPCLATPEFYHGLKAGFNVSLTDLWEFAKSIDDAQTYKDLYYAFKLVSCPFPCPEAKVLMGQIELLEGIKAKLKENVGVLPCYEDGLRVGKLFTDILVGEGVAALSSKGIRLIAKASAKVKIKAPLEKAAKVQGAGKVFTTAELKLLKRADLPDFVRNNIDGLLSDANRKAIWDLTDYCATCQFQRGDLIEEIFNHWGSKYKNYQNLNEVIPNYKTLDFDGVLNNVNEVVSLKTYQPKLATEKTLSGITGKINSYAGKLSSATLDAAHAGKNRVLDFVIKKGEWASFMPQIKDAIKEIQQDLGNVTIRITEF